MLSRTHTWSSFGAARARTRWRRPSRSLGALNLLVIALGGVVTAVLGALLPALWAARASVMAVLRAE